jgi:hypothetical protein
VADILEGEQIRARDGPGQREAVLDREERVLPAVDHDGGDGELFESPPGRVSVVDQVVIGERSLDVSGAIEHPRRDGTNRVFVHRHGFARTGPL